MPASFVMREPAQWEDSLVLVAMPAAGNAGSIAAHYIRKNLSLPMLGAIHVEGQEGVVAVEDGIAAGPIRIYGGQVECSLGDERCPTVHVIVSDVPISSAAVYEVTKAIIETGKKVKMILCLDSVAREKEDDKPDVYCTAFNQATLDNLKKSAVKPLPLGLIVGMTGQILLAAEPAGIPAGALLVEALRERPDGLAAAELVRAVDHLIPQVKVDVEPLLEEASQLDHQFRKAEQEAEGHNQRRTALSSYI